MNNSEQKKDCVFCQIIDGKLTAEFLVENHAVVAFADKNPLSKGHSLIVTKKHYENLSEIDQHDWNEIFPVFKRLLAKIENDYQPKGFNLVSNLGKEAEQTIMHLHLHLIPKYKKGEGFTWPLSDQ